MITPIFKMGLHRFKDDYAITGVQCPQRPSPLSVSPQTTFRLFDWKILFAAANEKLLSSLMDLGVIYFYTVAILDWTHLLETEKFKLIVLDSLIHLVKNEKLIVYGFVIMPNHIHIIWENVAMNGKEMPYESFMKFTGHAFLNELRQTNDPLLEKFKVDRNSRKHQFWQRNGLPIAMFNRKILEQKLDYTHYNPLQEHWKLVEDPNDYYYSSCSFYERDDKRFSWLTHYMDVF
jgi:putative transposase